MRLRIIAWCLLCAVHQFGTLLWLALFWSFIYICVDLSIYYYAEITYLFIY